jgi:hypothetical protein
MRIDRELHLIVPVYADEEGGQVIAYVHSTPLTEALVDQYFMILGQTYSTIMTQGLGPLVGPAHAMRVLKHVAQERGVWFDNANGQMGVERGLVEEIRRLTNVAALDKSGKWERLPLHEACVRGVLTPGDKSEVENAIVFFIVSYATLGRSQRPNMLRTVAGLWGAQVSSSNFTEWANSLKTSTATANSGAKSPALVKEEPAPANAMVGGKPSRVAF